MGFLSLNTAITLKRHSYHINLIVLILQLCSHVVMCAFPVYGYSEALPDASTQNRHITIVTAIEPSNDLQLCLESREREAEEETEEVSESSLYTFQYHSLDFYKLSGAAYALPQFVTANYLSVPSGIEPDPPKVA